MSYQTVANPQQINRNVSDYTTLKSDAGEGLLQSRVELFRAGAAITKGAIVGLVGPASATAKPHVIEKATAVPYAAVVGVANEACAAGDTVEVTVWGLAFVQVSTADPVVGDTAIIQANAPAAAVDADDPDATVIAGTVLGAFLGVEDANDLAPVWVQRL